MFAARCRRVPTTAMGSINTDRIPIIHWRSRAETVAEMARAGWLVRSECRHCRLMMRVDLELVAYVSGPATSLWNRTARCRRLHCPGFVDFWGQPDPRAHEFPLKAEWPPHKPSLKPNRRPPPWKRALARPAGPG